MDKRDEQYLNDPRTAEISDETGLSPDEVIEVAKDFAVANGDTVDEELTEAVEAVELAELAGGSIDGGAIRSEVLGY